MAIIVEIYDLQKKKVAILENAFNKQEEEKINSVGFFRFSLPGTDEKIKYCKDRHYVVFNNTWYRIMDKTIEDSEIRTVTFEAEHVLATLIDDVMFGHHIIGGRGYKTEQCINYVLSKQEEYNWQLNICEFDREFEYGFEQDNLLTAILSIAKPFDNYIFKTDTSSFPWKLNLLKIEIEKKPEIYIKNKKNLISNIEKSDPKLLCTRLFPLGYGEGVNQLNIKNVNDGVPYIESPPEIVSKYGIISKIWIDRRYEDASSLKAVAEKLLKNLQEPRIEYEIQYAQIDKNYINKIEIGKIVEVRINDEVFKTFITGNNKDYSEIENSTINIANTPSDIATSLADLADRQRIEMSYSQGATQIYAQSLQTNASKDYGAIMNFFIPQDMRIINKIFAKIKIESFRTYVEGTNAGGGVYASTDAGGGTHTSTDAGGSVQTSTDAGGGVYTSTDAGGGVFKSTDSGGGVQTTSEIESYVGGNGHNHGIGAGTKLAIANANYQVTGWIDFVESGNHKHSINMSPHSHEFRLDAHSHNLTVPQHSHNFRLNAHNHVVKINPHSHQVKIEDHKHEIKAGIYRFGNPSSFALKINGAEKNIYNVKDVEVDITELLVGQDGKIARGVWHSVEIVPNDLAYVSIDISLQGFVQSRGDKTV